VCWARRARGLLSAIPDCVPARLATHTARRIPLLYHHSYSYPQSIFSLHGVLALEIESNRQYTTYLASTAARRQASGGDWHITCIYHNRTRCAKTALAADCFHSSMVGRPRRVRYRRIGIERHGSGLDRRGLYLHIWKSKDCSICARHGVAWEARRLYLFARQTYRIPTFLHSIPRLSSLFGIAAILTTVLHCAPFHLVRESC
jgi:hypothetical protein